MNKIPDGCTEKYIDMSETCTDLCRFDKESCPYNLKDIVPKEELEIQEEWFEQLVLEGYALNTVFHRKEKELRMEFYHTIGGMVNSAIKQHSRSEDYGLKIMHNCAKAWKIDDRSMYYACTFAREYKLDDALVRFKNWTSAKLAIDGGKRGKRPCEHKNIELRPFCLDCRKWVKNGQG